jgi:hypothetical protein
LLVYCKHLAWLNATPEGSKKTRFAQCIEKPEMPDLEGCDHLMDYLFRMRPGTSNGMGYISKTWPEIESWARLVKIRLTGWEAETLAQMSEAYCGQLAASAKKDCPAPWTIITEETIVSNRDKVATGIMAAFRGAGSKKQQPAKKRAR